MEDTKPTVDMPLNEAMEDLTGFEVIAIEQHFGKALERLSGSQAVIGTIWAFSNRDHKTEWAAIKSMSMKMMGAYFADKDPDPDSDQGKASDTEPKPPDD